MNSKLPPLVWFIVLFLWSAVALSQEEITEEYVVRNLSGESHGSVLEAPLGFAVTLTFNPPSSGAPIARQQVTEGNAWLDEQFYKKLIPIGRALESDALQGFRYEIAVEPEAGAADDRARQLALQVAETIQWFLTTYFAIDAARFSIIRPEAPSPRSSSVADSTTASRWRVEIRYIAPR
ncbi:MAG TPA: hypothetical protein VNP04_22300 [Alphaproteobacteria bacterium]|nr:hypothetical protein [Alphaproteobacteria bacterium]